MCVCVFMCIYVENPCNIMKTNKLLKISFVEKLRKKKGAIIFYSIELKGKKRK